MQSELDGFQALCSDLCTGIVVAGKAVALTAAALRENILAYAGRHTGTDPSAWRIDDCFVLSAANRISLVDLHAAGLCDGHRFEAKRRAYLLPWTTAFNVQGVRLAVHVDGLWTTIIRYDSRASRSLDGGAGPQTVASGIPGLHRTPTAINQSSTEVSRDNYLVQPYLPMLNLMKAARYILFACLLCPPATLLAQTVSITVAPPPLVAYEQPPCPGDGYFWSPGYWAYGDDGYFWVPGTWVEVPQPGYLWTPGYWAFGDGFYHWHHGYWGPHIGYYGGINYGFGYYGSGFYGGRWEGNDFRYNTAVWNVNTNVVHNTYVDRTAVNNGAANNRVSFNGPGGIEARPTAAQEAAAHDHHLEATASQRTREQQARSDRNQRFSVNHGQPATLVQTTAGAHPAGAHPGTAAHPEAVRHEGAQTGAVHHGTAAHPQTAHHETAAHPETEHHQAAAHPETEHHQAAAAHPETVHHQAAAHPEAAHQEAAHHAAPRQAPKPQPRKSSGGGEKKERKG